MPYINVDFFALFFCIFFNWFLSTRRQQRRRRLFHFVFVYSIFFVVFIAFYYKLYLLTLYSISCWLLLLYESWLKEKSTSWPKRTHAQFCHLVFWGFCATFCAVLCYAGHKQRSIINHWSFGLLATMTEYLGISVDS